MLRVLWLLPFALFSCKGQVMTGEEIAALLPGRVMAGGGHPTDTLNGHTWQFWRADGSTVTSGFILRGWGDWKVDGNRYCELMGIMEEWECYTVYRRPGPEGLTLHFEGPRSQTGFLMPEGTPFP